uniref:Transmembrane channel-like protein 3 n=1 Tax=Magallana gigas TaxID=29159 RepID=K1R2X3_MAGGI
MGKASKPSTTSLMRGQGRLIQPQSPEGELVDDMYLEELMHPAESSIGALFVFTRWVLMTNLVLSVFWISLVVVPMAISFPYSNVTQGFALGNIVDGQGVLGEVWMFYGGYQYRALGGMYPLALAYLFLIILTYFGTLFVIMKSVARAASPQSSTAAESRFKFSLMTLSSWDYSVTSPEASINLSKGIVSMLKDHIYEVKAKEAADKFTNKTKIYALRVLAWIITM